MIKSITNFLIIFFIIQQYKSQISQIDQNGVNPFCDETLHILVCVMDEVSVKRHFMYIVLYNGGPTNIFEWRLSVYYANEQLFRCNDKVATQHL